MLPVEVYNESCGHCETCLIFTWLMQITWLMQEQTLEQICISQLTWSLCVKCRCGHSVGVGEVIKGWDRGVAGMRVGDKRKLTVPPQMGYGSDGVRGSIPSNATLLFNVELVDVK